MSKNLKSQKAFSLIEMMIVITILSVMVGAAFTIMASGQAAWLTADTQSKIQESLRQTLDKVSKELRETGSDEVGTMQIAISDNTGVNSSDIITFSMPIVCEATGSIIDVNGDVDNWGAPLTWGCTSSTCMDADDDCTTVDYDSVEYRIDASNRLVRRVLNAATAVVRSEIFAHDVTDFQAALSADQNVVTLTVTSTQTTDQNRSLSASISLNVRLRNRG